MTTKELVLKPQFIFLILGGWLLVFGLSGTIAREGEPTNTNATTPQINAGGNRLRVVPAQQRPGSTIDQLQGAQSLQTQGSGLQQQDQNPLQPNSGLSDFPAGSDRLQ